MGGGFVNNGQAELGDDHPLFWLPLSFLPSSSSPHDPSSMDLAAQENDRRAERCELNGSQVQADKQGRRARRSVKVPSPTSTRVCSGKPVVCGRIS